MQEYLASFVVHFNFRREMKSEKKSSFIIKFTLCNLEHAFENKQKTFLPKRGLRMNLYNSTGQVERMKQKGKARLIFTFIQV